MSALSAPAVAGLSWKGIAIATTVGLAIVGGVQALRAQGPKPTSVAQPRAMLDSVDETLEAPVVSSQGRTRPAAAVPIPAPAEPIHPTRPRSRPASPAPTPDGMPVGDAASVGLQAEVELIERATAALRAGDAPGALSTLLEHARRFPAGQLAGERRAYRAVALCSAGKTRQGRAEARLSRATKPSKALIAWLDAACGPPSPGP